MIRAGMMDETIRRAELHEAIETLRVHIEDQVRRKVWEDVKEAVHEQVEEEFEDATAEEQATNRELGFVTVTAEMARPVYEVKESIWDCCLFINLGLLGPIRSVCIVFSVLANYFFQAMFLVVADDMGKTDIGDPGLIQEMRIWRLTFGHSIDYASIHSNLPLIAYVCGNDEHRAMQMEGNRQADLFDDIQAYLDGRGDLLCLLAVTVWIMTIFIELQSIIHFTKAMWHGQATHDRHHLFTKIVVIDGRFEVKDLNQMRAVLLILLVSVPRTMIALILGFHGIRYLTATASMG